MPLQPFFLQVSCNFCPIIYYWIQGYLYIADIPGRCLCLTQVPLTTCHLASRSAYK